jgi:hypothetical protein
MASFVSLLTLNTVENHTTYNSQIVEQEKMTATVIIILNKSPVSYCKLRSYRLDT